jgi:hypothetical protein
MDCAKAGEHRLAHGLHLDLGPTSVVNDMTSAPACCLLAGLVQRILLHVDQHQGSLQPGANADALGGNPIRHPISTAVYEIH